MKKSAVFENSSRRQNFNNNGKQMQQQQQQNCRGRMANRRRRRYGWPQQLPPPPAPLPPPAEPAVCWWPAHWQQQNPVHYAALEPFVASGRRDALPRLSTSRYNTVTVELWDDVLVEVLVAQRAVRVCRVGMAAATVSDSLAAIYHRNVRLVQQQGYVCADFAPDACRVRVDPNSVRLLPPPPTTNNNNKNSGELVEAEFYELRKGQSRPVARKRWDGGGVGSGGASAFKLPAEQLPAELDLSLSTFVNAIKSVPPPGVRRQDCEAAIERSAVSNGRSACQVRVAGVRIRHDLIAGQLTVDVDQSQIVLNTSGGFECANSANAEQKTTVGLVVRTPLADLQVDRAGNCRIETSGHKQFVVTNLREGKLSAGCDETVDLSSACLFSLATGRPL